MEKLDYDMDHIDSNHASESVLLTICENSDGSQDLITAANDDVKYEVSNNEGVFQYRLLNTVPQNEMNNESSPINPTPVANAQSSVQSTNCHFYVINDLTANRPVLISPKVSSDTTPSAPRPQIGGNKKRDEKRRATHNEVERRRRDKINHWIFKLKDLLPDNNDPKLKTNGGDSKGVILIKACDYIRTLQEDNQSLRECLKPTDKLSMENKTLRDKNEQLRKENERLTSLLSGKEVKLESDFEYDSS